MRMFLDSAIEEMEYDIDRLLFELWMHTHPGSPLLKTKVELVERLLSEGVIQGEIVEQAAKEWAEKEGV